MSEQTTIEQTERVIIDNFSLFDSGDDKAAYLIDLGKELPALDEEYKTNLNTVRGCQSTVWLVSFEQDGKVFFKADSNTVIVKGMVSILVKILSGHTPDEIINAKLAFMGKIGVGSQRSNGLLSMIKQMKNDALVYKLKNEA